MYLIFSPEHGVGQGLAQREAEGDRKLFTLAPTPPLSSTSTPQHPGSSR